MDAVVDPQPPPSARPPPPLDIVQPPLPPKHASTTQVSPKRAPRDAKPNRASPRSSEPAARKDPSLLKPTPRLAGKSAARAAMTAARPLVPVTERRSCEERSWSRDKRDLDPSKWDVAPDGASAGREGRQFAVANVGNNGRIYLRPTVRPAHQRCPQPTFTFPVTPPSTGGLESLSHEKSSSKDARSGNGPEVQTSPWTPTPSVSPFAADAQYFPGSRNPPITTRQRRAMSDSTMNDLAVASERDEDSFRVVISKPGDDRRPRTMEDFNPANAPLLDINIPSWRIGTPRFTLRGTPVIRGSSYAPTEDLRSSGLSAPNHSSRSPSVPASLRARKVSPLVLHPLPPGPSAQRGARALPSPRLLRSTYISTHLVIEPAMFTDLTFRPACDDRSIVRYSSAGAVTAATPPRLVAEITSPSFLDYELISDFFLTFRAFLDPVDLLRMLIARLRWALMRSDEVGMIVRVRTFVAVRHWILNYFLDDFVLEYSLRATFCDLLNEFVDELSQDASCRKVQLKILAELKKCWRRVCAEYWDGPEFGDSLGPEASIAPGGLPGSRDPNLDPGFWAREGLDPPQLDLWIPVPKTSTASASFYPDAPGTAAPIGDFIILGNRPGTPENRVGRAASGDTGPGSPLSLASLDIVSCSLPGKATKVPNSNAAHMIAHPVPSRPTASGTGQVAATPKALVGKRVRPTQLHKRNNSISDSLRERGSDKASSHEQDFPTVWPSAGSLVRGDLLPPGLPFVDYEPQGLHRCSLRQTAVFQPKNRALAKERAAGGPMSGYGMRKLLGSVRRALRSRGQGSPPWHSNFVAMSPVGPLGATTSRLPGTAVVPQNLPRQNGCRPPVRIDLLGAEVAEDFKKAIREEEAAAEAERLAFAAPPNSAPLLGGDPDYSAAHMESSTFDSVPQNQRPRPASDMGISAGSKSIVVVDGTVPFELVAGRAVMTGRPTAGVFADAITTDCADPTPPDTPPPSSVQESTPRRCSYLSGQHATTPHAVDGALPPHAPDLTPGDNHGGYGPEDLSRPSLSAARRRMRRPLMSGGTFRLQRRNRSAGTPQSLDSIIHSRYVSLGGSTEPPSTKDSLDSAVEVAADNRFDMVEPAPLRVLRRRPGGDLRAAANVGDLDRESLRRSLSVGSLATYTESVRSSFLPNARSNSLGRSDSPASRAEEGRQEVFSLSRLAEKPTTAHLSLFHAHSSKPVMRASFEKEAQMLAQIPDDEDDGGIESALLKLEGKYEKKLPALPRDSASADAAAGAGDTGPNDGQIDHDDLTRRLERKENRHVHVLDEVATEADDEEGLTLRKFGGGLEAQDSPSSGVKSFLSEGSHESYYSIPLLERGLSDGSPSRTATWEWTDRSVLRGSEDDSPVEIGNGSDAAMGGDAGHLSFNIIQKTESMERIKPGESAPSEVGNHSFLDDSTDSTDISTELSTDGLGACDVDGHMPPSKQGPPGQPCAVTATAAAHRHSGRQMTLIQALAMTPGSATPSNEGEAQATAQQPLPTPELSPAAPLSRAPPSPRGPGGAGETPLGGALKPNTWPLHKYSVHLPFVLAFDSDVLAQQFTLIEKDALNDIDWKELIDMKWKNAARSDSRSWVDFLRHSDAQGVEVVIARFNIMVKWAISEIVLTQRVEERARCIIKLIHVAAHCRRYRNFATVAQLTIALSSHEVARLSKTWELVPAHDVETLDGLENLVTPTRNFHAIRAEMEMGSDAGCIPFVGIYTHDLLYNAQRPSEIAGSPTTAPLINFERCRIGAAVVKTLLRLLEASTRYSFLPIEGITERCLWIGALSDEEIRRRSDGLE
ncbi:hypothetical protein CDD83_6753 [Cordyceps sp. RAO-2017]|nr:hypothetical protein CDD83_6753 [Cordyceps sp. RAO-2017]